MTGKGEAAVNGHLHLRTLLRPHVPALLLALVLMLVHWVCPGS